jgi:class 3 adenylate cyclase
LFDVFPRHIAEKLMAGQRDLIQPEHRECVTIFFSDIVGFTDISSQLDPLKVSEMLHRLYTTFDALSSEHQVFKVVAIYYLHSTLRSTLSSLNVTLCLNEHKVFKIGTIGDASITHTNFTLNFVIFKVETIGDAYMAVTNLAADQEHAQKSSIQLCIYVHKYINAYMAVTNLVADQDQKFSEVNCTEMF